MRRKAATAALKGIVSRDPLEGMLAAQLLATHKAAIGSFHHANPRPSRQPGRQERGPRQTKERSCLAITSVRTQPAQSLESRRGGPQTKNAPGRARGLVGDQSREDHSWPLLLVRRIGYTGAGTRPG